MLLSLLYGHYAFAYTQEYLADRIFVKHKIKVDFGKGYANADSLITKRVVPLFGKMETEQNYIEEGLQYLSNWQVLFLRLKSEKGWHDVSGIGFILS